MDAGMLEEIVACLPQGRTLFLYERDRYAVSMLRWLMDAGGDPRALRQGRFGRLFEKPPVRSFLAARGRPDLTRADLDLLPMEAPVAWRLTLGRWGHTLPHAMNQTARKGLNLVLQLNFSRGHDEAFDRVLAPCIVDKLNYRQHPVAARDRTFAWARLDLDMTTGEALIEEIQSDWMRNMHWYGAHSWRAAHLYDCMCLAHRAKYADAGQMAAALRIYETELLAPLAEYWQETMMAATLAFLVDELGLRDIWMHQFESGNLLKRIHGDKLPPRSVYTDLPRRFCFATVDSGPSFLADAAQRMDRRQRAKARQTGPLQFWRLDLSRRAISRNEAA